MLSHFDHELFQRDSDAIGWVNDAKDKLLDEEPDLVARFGVFAIDGEERLEGQVDGVSHRRNLIPDASHLDEDIRNVRQISDDDNHRLQSLSFLLEFRLFAPKSGFDVVEGLREIHI